MSIPIPEKLSLAEDTARNAANWERFHEAWKNYEIASGLNEKDKKIKLATFLTIIGEDGMMMYNNYKTDHPEDVNDIDKLIELFKEDLSKRTNLLHERYQFLNRKQRPEETIDQFVQQLRILSKT